MNEILKFIEENPAISLVFVIIIAIVLLLIVFFILFRKQIAEVITRLTEINFSKSNESSKTEFNAHLASQSLPDTKDDINNAQPPNQPVPDIKDKKNLEITEEALYSNVGVSQLIIEWEARIWELIKEKSPDLHSEHHNNPFNKWLVRELAAAQITAEFELVYNFIYGSQIHLLKLINQVGIPMLNNDMYNYFLEVKEKFPDFYKNHEVNHYLIFLLNHSLIIHEEKSYNITIRGIEFLGWMTKIGRNEDKNL